MCGIAGIIGLKDRNIASEKIKTMSRSLAHRGPDAEGFLLDENACLAHRRLSIIDLSENANQPIFDSSARYAIILNGEIYNYQEIKAELKDFPFQTDSDTEAILAAYLKYGANCLSRLNGMFAFAIWDKFEKKLFIARDRLGVKPLYYAITKDNVLVFSSEIRAILDTELLERKLDRESLYDYLLFQSVYSPKTIVDGIFQLPAGHFGVFSDSKFEIKPFWEIEKTLNFEVPNDAEAVKKQLRELLLKAVERRLISDVRLGAFLSGGIDSSAIVALMSEVSASPVDTFSVNFAEKEFDESFYSNLIAKKFNTRHSTVQLSAKNFLEELPEALKAADSPSGDGLNTYIVSKATKNAGLKVALSGLGGDELFAGYPNFVKFHNLQKSIFSKMPQFLRSPASFALAFSKQTKNQRLAELIKADKLSVTNIYPLSRQVISQRNADDFIKNGHHQTMIRKILSEKENAIEKFPLLSRFSIAELLGYTQNVLLKDTDQFSMASALEVREPFFDYHLVEYVLQIPDEIKFPKYPKSLLVETISPLLPKEIVHRRKMGFVLPWEKWMRNELREFCQNRLEVLAEREIFNPSAIKNKWQDFLKEKNGVLWSHLWHLVVLTEWLENNKF